jgi:Tfp pilus assembly protein PilX
MENTMKKIVATLRDDQSGMTLMIVMLLLFLLTLLGMTMYFMSSTDLKISRNVYTGTRAFYAAESGISEAIGRLNLSSTDPEYDAAMFDNPPYDSTSLGWSYSFSGELDNGDKYDVTIEHKADTNDLDGDAVTDEIVTYDKGFFTDMTHYYPAAGTGYAIEVIRSKGISADGEVVMVLEITKFPMDVKAKGAVSANSTVELRGNFEANGFDHDMDGNLLPAGTGNDVPGVITTSDNSVDLIGASEANGDPPIIDEDNGGGWDPADAAWGPYPESPGDVLGLTDAEAAAFFADADYYGPYDGDIGRVAPLSGITYITGDYPGPWEGGTGILVVHNPNYDPTKYEAAKVFAESGGATVLPGYDASYDYTDSANQPARLGNYASNATFKGLIIADIVYRITGTPTIIGAVVSLSSIDTQTFGTGNAEVLYSSEALNAFTSMGFSKKLAWYKE